MNGLMRFWRGFKHGKQRQREINEERQQSTASGDPQDTTSDEPTDYYSRYERVKDLIWDYKFKAFHLTQEELDQYISKGIVSSEDWQELRSLGDREEHEARLKKIRRDLKDAVRKDVISSFVYRNCQNGKAPSAKYALEPDIATEIATLLHEGKEESLQFFLTDVLQSGLEAARKKREKTSHRGWVGESGWELGGAYWGFAWETMRGLFTVAIVLVVLSAARSPFETIAFALLLLIYNATLYGFDALPTLGFATAVLFAREFQRVRRLLNDEPPDEIRESEKRDEREFQKAEKRMVVVGYIRGTFALITWVIIIAALISAVL